VYLNINQAYFYFRQLVFNHITLSAMSDQFNDAFDRTLWPDRRGPFVEHAAATFWQFCPSEDANIVKVIMNRSGQTIARSLLKKHAPILAFLDISLRHSIAEKEAGDTNSRRVAHYLQKLCTAVEEKLNTMPEDESVPESSLFGPLRFWAIRTCHSLGHSETGRRRYIEQCQTNDVTPYQEDPMEYGAYHVLRFHVTLMKTRRLFFFRLDIIYSEEIAIVGTHPVHGRPIAEHQQTGKRRKGFF
jgi:hypothetical protein